MNHIVFTRESAVAIRNELKEVQCSDVFVLVDNNSRNYCLNSLNLGAVPVEHIITIAEGEHNKSFLIFGKCYRSRGPDVIPFW